MDRIRLINKIEKAFRIKFAKGTIITRGMAFKAIPRLIGLKGQMVSALPKRYTIRIRKELKTSRHAITVLRDTLKMLDMKLLSKRKNHWDKMKKKQFTIYTYIII